MCATESTIAANDREHLRADNPEHSNALFRPDGCIVRRNDGLSPKLHILAEIAAAEIASSGSVPIAGCVRATSKKHACETFDLIGASSARGGLDGALMVAKGVADAARPAKILLPGRTLVLAAGLGRQDPRLVGRRHPPRP